MYSQKRRPEWADVVVAALLASTLLAAVGFVGWMALAGLYLAWSEYGVTGVVVCLAAVTAAVVAVAWGTRWILRRDGFDVGPWNRGGRR